MFSHPIVASTGHIVALLVVRCKSLVRHLDLVVALLRLIIASILLIKRRIAHSFVGCVQLGRPLITDWLQLWRMTTIVLLIIVEAIHRAYITHLLICSWTHGVITARTALFLLVAVDSGSARHVTIRVCHHVVILALLLMLLCNVGVLGIGACRTVRRGASLGLGYTTRSIISVGVVGVIINRVGRDDTLPAATLTHSVVLLCEETC